MKKIKLAGVSHWFEFSSFFLLIATMLLVLGRSYFDNSNGWWFKITDIVLFLSIPYLFVPIMRRLDRERHVELRGKYDYVNFPSNDWRGFMWVGIQIFYLILSFIHPFVCFILIIPLPFAISIYRVAIKDKKVFPQ